MGKYMTECQSDDNYAYVKQDTNDLPNDNYSTISVVGSDTHTAKRL